MISREKRVTSLIVGAGAVENAWDPVLKALNKHHYVQMTPDGANAFLARLVYMLRWWSSDKSEHGKAEYEKTKSFLSEVRRDICKELKRAEEKKLLRVRPEFEDVIYKRVLAHSGGVLLVTTNWDNVVGRALYKTLNTATMKFDVEPIFIHGSYRTPSLLYLPTETTKEPYRERDEERRIGETHGGIWRAMNEAHRSVVYGLSISPLDAELGQTLATGWASKSMREIEVIAPDHESVAHRVNLLIDPKYPVSVRGYHPSDLDTPTDHTVRYSL